jgi:hypothetical protein
LRVPVEALNYRDLSAAPHFFGLLRMSQKIFDGLSDFADVERINKDGTVVVLEQLAPEGEI